MNVEEARFENLNICDTPRIKTVNTKERIHEASCTWVLKQVLTCMPS